MCVTCASRTAENTPPLDELKLVSSGGDSDLRRTSTELKFSVMYIRVQCHQPVGWVSFLGQPTIRTRQILLGFHPSVQITSQFMSHDWELLVCMKVNSDQNISLEVIENLARTNNVAENDEAMPYLASWHHRRCSTLNSVPRQTFVIHPNGGWWQSIHFSKFNKRPRPGRKKKYLITQFTFKKIRLCVVGGAHSIGCR
jgi:hypothetical protein